MTRRLSTLLAPLLLLLLLAAAPPLHAQGVDIDADGDGRPELYLGTTPADLSDPYAHGALFEGSNLISLSPTQEFVHLRSSGTGPHGLLPGCSLGDIDGDGRGDIVLTRSFDNDGVHMFLGGASGLVTPAAQSIYSPLGRLQTGSGSGFGAGVDAGDVDGDRRLDLAVGAVDYVYLFRGIAGGRFERAPVSAVWSPGAFGFVQVGDVNGDGHADVLAAAPGHDSLRGRVDVFLGGPAGLDPTPASLFGPATGSFFGLAFVVEDWNRDGFADLAVSAPRYQRGRVFVYLGSATGLSAAPSAVLAPGIDHWDLGGSMGGAGDWNGDGFPDLAASFVSPDNTVTSVNVYAGSASGVGASPEAVLTGPPMARDMIVPVGCGDLDGDGNHDVAVALRTTRVGVPTEIRLYRGGARGLVAAPAQVLSGTTPQGNTISANLMGHNPGLPRLNEAPVAEAGPDQAIAVGQAVFLLGAGTDDDTAPEVLAYSWSFVSRPASSGAVLAGGDTSSASFLADAVGDYVVQLVVTDQRGLSSAPDQVVVSSGNLAPTADAGPDRSTVVGQAVVLDGSGSSDPNGHATTHAWTLVSRPAGSAAGLSSTSDVSPILVPDLPGAYTVQLVVSDAYSSSAADEVVVSAISGSDHAQMRIGDALNLIAALNASSFRAPGHRQALSNFLTQAVTAIQAGDLAQARRKLDEALERVDGIVLRGAPDGNGHGMDWVVDGNGAWIYQALTDALGYI